VLAQDGSTGGAIGKQGKSVSGGEEQSPQRATPGRPVIPANPTPGTAANRCTHALGVWAFNNGIDVVLKNRETASATNGDSGTWSCDSGIVTVKWRGHADRYTISSNGTQITGISGFMGMALSAVKK
jgi:hypothetical protein